MDWICFFRRDTFRPKEDGFSGATVFLKIQGRFALKKTLLFLKEGSVFFIRSVFVFLNEAGQEGIIGLERVFTGKLTGIPATADIRNEADDTVETLLLNL